MSATVAAEIKVPRRKKSTWSGDSSFSMNSYVQKLARKALSIYPTGSISADAVDVLDGLATNVCDLVVDTACRATVAKRRKARGNTLTARAVQAGFAAHVPDPVASPLQKYLVTAVQSYNVSRSTDEQGVQRAERAGITFSVTRVERRMRARTRGAVPHISGDAAVALAAGLEFLIAVIISKSIEVAHSLDASRIDSVHIAETLKNSSGLAFEHLFEHTYLANAGVQNAREAPRYAIPPTPVKREPKREPEPEPAKKKQKKRKREAPSKKARSGKKK